MPTAAIFGCSGLSLTPLERRFLIRRNPVGFILFKRNVADPRQVRSLVDELRGCVGRADAPVSIDQEGGRVMRLQPPHWPMRAPAAALGSDGRAAWLQGRLIASDLRALGITMNCAPVADLTFPGAHDVIGDRAFSDDPAMVAAAAGAFARGLLAGGVLPVLKHLPGHGRAAVDSHLATPRVTASRADLAARDFQPFHVLRDLPVGMTAHVIYEAIDPARVATLSPVVVAEIIRGEIGFDGLLLTDDLSMHALGGGFAERAAAARAAGCDLALHCNGDLAEMAGVAEGAGSLNAAGADRLERALGLVAGYDPHAVDPAPLQAELDDLLSRAARTGLRAKVNTPMSVPS